MRWVWAPKPRQGGRTEQSVRDFSHNHSPQTLGFKIGLPIRGIIKGTCLAVLSLSYNFWWAVRRLSLTRPVYPLSNSIMWLLMPSYVASGNKAIFQLLISSPFSTHPARIIYSSVSESPQKTDFFFPFGEMVSGKQPSPQDK